MKTNSTFRNSNSIRDLAQGAYSPHKPSDVLIFELKRIVWEFPPPFDNTIPGILHNYRMRIIFFDINVITVCVCLAILHARVCVGRFNSVESVEIHGRRTGFWTNTALSRSSPP